MVGCESRRELMSPCRSSLDVAQMASMLAAMNRYAEPSSRPRAVHQIPTVGGQMVEARAAVATGRSLAEHSYSQAVGYLAEEPSSWAAQCLAEDSSSAAVPRFSRPCLSQQRAVAHSIEQATRPSKLRASSPAPNPVLAV